MFAQANTCLRSRDGPTTPENVGLAGQTGAAAATEAAGQERNESALGELPGPSAGATVAGAGGIGGTGGLPLPTVDSATVCLVGATPSVVDLDLLDQEVRGIRMSNASSVLAKHKVCEKVAGRES